MRRHFIVYASSQSSRLSSSESESKKRQVDATIEGSSGTKIDMYIDSILKAYENGSMRTKSTIQGRLNSYSYDDVLQTLNSCAPEDIIDLYRDVCDPTIPASSYSNNHSYSFTEEERELIESQCYEAWENYGNDCTIEELAQIVWEHVEWLQNDLEDVSGNITKQSVIQYAEQYISDNF